MLSNENWSKMNLLLNDGCFMVIRQNGDYVFGVFFFFQLSLLSSHCQYNLFILPQPQTLKWTYILISSYPGLLPIKLFEDWVPSYCVPVLPTNQFSRFCPFILEVCLSKVLAWNGRLSFGRTGWIRLLGSHCDHKLRIEEEGTANRTESLSL